VLVDNYLPDVETDVVASDNFHGAYEATRFLIGEGKRRILYVGFARNMVALEERFRGYRAALAEKGIPVRQELICRSIPGPHQVYSAMEEVFRGDDAPDAIFTESLMYFTEGFRFLSDYGLTIPDRIMLTGFDPVDVSLNEMNNLHLHSLVTGSIPFVEQKGLEMGATAARMLVDRIRGKTGKPEKIFLKPDLYFSQVSGEVHEPGILQNKSDSV